MENRWQKKFENVTWGYRDKFGNIIHKLEEQGYLKKDKRSFPIFNDILDKLIDKKYVYDVVLKEFLSALDQNLSWILSRPELMEEWSYYGIDLMEEEWYYARKYFSLWSDSNNFNLDDPSEVRFILTILHSLKQNTDTETVLFFLEGYQELRDLLSRPLIKSFIEEGLAVYKNNLETGRKFFKLDLVSARKTIKRLTTDCTLDQIKARMERLIQSFCGKELNIDNFLVLDSDELLEKGSELICLNDGLYVPQRVNIFNKAKQNRDFYLGVSYIAAFCHLYNGFSLVHGYPGYQSSPDYLYGKVDTDDLIFYQNLFYLADVIRILSRGVSDYPGFKIFLKTMVEIEYQIKPFQENKSDTIFEKLLYRALHQEQGLNSRNYGTSRNIITPKINKYYQILKGEVESCDSFQDITDKLPYLFLEFKKIWKTKKTDYFLRSLLFFPDYRYRAQLSDPPGEKLDLTNMNDEDNSRDNTDNNKEQEKQPQLTADNKEGKDKDEIDKKGENTRIGYFYDEWNQEIEEYYQDWCCLQEIRSDFSDKRSVININEDKVRKIKHVFEKIKPESMKKEKNLLYGDDIVIDSLIKFLVEQKAGVSPYPEIYSKFYKNERDIAFSLLIDVSGSTGEEVEEGKVLEVEKKAAFLMAEGLKLLGDKFGIFGFSGCGRNDCHYYIYKNFKEKWEDKQKQSLYSASPDNSTRIGVAIRHSVNKMEKIEAKKKIIILITDGKPQDKDGYSPDNKYAQYDVRKACLEAQGQGITVFGLSTETNLLNDLEIMFPGSRYVMIKDIKKLPELLAKFYIKLTA
ncbi:MAG: nitric oxide reductase activation protein NorD [Halanaerobiales bacterium]